MKFGSLGFSLIFWAIGIALAVWIARCSANQLIISAGLCAVIPLFAMTLAALSAGRIVISGQKSEQRPDAIGMLMLPSLGLCIRALGPVHLIDWQLCLTYAGGIAIVWSSLAYFAGTFSKYRGRFVTFAFLFLVGLAYGYGAVCLMNSIFDRESAQTHEVLVKDKYIGSGKGHTPYLVLAPSTVNKDGGDESVAREVYDSAVANQKVCLVEHPGYIRLRWYEILLCQNAS